MPRYRFASKPHTSAATAPSPPTLEPERRGARVELAARSRGRLGLLVDLGPEAEPLGEAPPEAPRKRGRERGSAEDPFA